MSEHQQLRITDHHLGLISTISGKIIDLRNPQPRDISIRDIASGLSKICRFGGQCNQFYSVAQHSVLVAHLVRAEYKRYALLHDATKAYLGDVIKPLKVILGTAYNDLEAGFLHAILGHFFLSHSYEAALPEIKRADVLALQIEDEAFRQGDPKRFRFYYDKFGLLYADPQLGWPPFIAETIFRKYCNIL